MADAGGLRICVVYSPGSREVREWLLELPQGATVGQALLASGIAVEFPLLDRVPPEVGVWGRKAPLDQPLRDRDRVEVYRPLLVDPKVARRERFRSQGSRAAGLFSKKRPGAKPGY